MVSKRALALPDRCLRLVAGRQKPASASVCPFCSLAPSRGVPHRSPRSRRLQSTTASPSRSTARADLERNLIELQRRNPTLLDPHRVQLALQGLRQQAGYEAVRVAILGLSLDPGRKDTARRVLKALLADPLTDQQDWERALDEHDTSAPLVVRVEAGGGRGARLEVAKGGQAREMSVSSAVLNGANLEFLLMNVPAPTTADELLVPAVEIQSPNNRSTLLPTPVHQALIVADGLKSASHISALGANALTTAAVDLEGFSGGKLEADMTVIDASLAGRGIDFFRKGPQHAMEYERCWRASNLAPLAAWLKAAVKTQEDETKPAVRKLIASLLHGALSDIHAESKRAKTVVSGDEITGTAAPPEIQALNTSLEYWAQQAHAELQDQLDLAFTGVRWRKLGWWKLFWRVDDVAMITNGLLSQRFLPTAEQELVYLAGRVAQLQGKPGRYTQPRSLRGSSGESSGEEEQQAPVVPTIARPALPRWPGHIAFTRRYLQNETVPALQSLAQRLVVESLATSSLTGALAGLLYVSSFASSVFEAGAVAALGAVYSLGRMQKRWDAARDFWEGEVREEGRKAVRAAERSVAEVLHPAQSVEVAARRLEELEEAEALVTRARDALARMK